MTWLQTYEFPERHPNKPLLCCIHGIARSAHVLRPFAEICWERFDVGLIDLPGHGQSPLQTFDDFETVAAAVATAIRSHFAHRPIVIVGESLGGLLALSMAAGPPPNLTAVVLVDPPMEPSRQPKLVESLEGFTAPECPPALRTAKSVLGVDEGKSFLHLLDDVRVPALFILADKGSLAPPSAAFRPHRTTVLPGSAHNVLTGAARAAANEIDRFVADITK